LAPVATFEPVADLDPVLALLLQNFNRIGMQTVATTRSTDEG